MGKKKRKGLLLLLVALMSVISGCAGAGSSEQNTKTERDTLRIVTSFYPMYIATCNVVRNIDGVEVVNMTKPQTGCLHDYQLTPEDLKTLEQADLFVVNGAGMESFLDKVVSEHPALKVVEASRGIAMLQSDGAVNPHVWGSVTNAIRQVENIAAQLAAADAKNAAAYQRNAALYVERLKALRDDMHQTLDVLPNRQIITFHEAFLYLAEEFQLEIAAVVDSEPGTEVTPQQLKETIQLVKESGVTALFTEPQYMSSSADTIARESGVKVYVLDPVVTGPLNEAVYDAYLTAMQKNSETLAEALKEE